MCEVILTTTVERKKICTDMYLCSVWGNTLAYLKCELACLEFFSTEDTVMIQTLFLEQFKTSIYEICKQFIRNGIAP